MVKLLHGLYSCLENLLASDYKNISTVKNTQSKKLLKLLFNNVSNVSKITHDLDEVIFKLSNNSLNNHENTLFCEGLNSAIPPKNINYSNYL